jgi:predicted N-acyltransferase
LPQEPFSRHAYLHALEASGSVGDAQTGWQPCHLVLRDGAGELCAAMPLYVKTDSYGEYIFDWSWAQAAHDIDLPYYPKLVSAMPFTPATGRRILRRPHTPLSEVLGPLVQGALAVQQRLGASGVHLLFCQPDEAEALAQAGFISRHSFQFHWQRAPHWHTFGDFLADMRAPCRKQVRKERARAQGHGLALSMRPIQDVCQADVDAMYLFYRQTVWEKGAIAYLTRDFFARLKDQGDDRVLLAMAHDGATAVAGALFFRAAEHLYGRYWGACDHYDALHFELCYYLPIQWCLGHGVKRFEAGAQGEHKLKRGFLPNACHSAHHLRHEGLHRAVAHFCAQEAEAVGEHMAALMPHGPFHHHSASTGRP